MIKHCMKGCIVLSPSMDCTRTKCRWCHPWCGDDAYVLGWGLLTPKAMVWDKAARHHGLPDVERRVWVICLLWHLVRSIFFSPLTDNILHVRFGLCSKGDSLLSVWYQSLVPPPPKTSLPFPRNTVVLPLQTPNGVWLSIGVSNTLLLLNFWDSVATVGRLFHNLGSCLLESLQASPIADGVSDSPMSESTYLACCWPFRKTPAIPHWYQRGRAPTQVPDLVTPLQPFCGKTRQSKRLLSILIVQSRISGNLLSSLFIYTLTCDSSDTRGMNFGGWCGTLTFARAVVQGYVKQGNWIPSAYGKTCRPCPCHRKAWTQLCCSSDHSLS